MCLEKDQQYLILISLCLPFIVSLFGVDDACQITDPRARVHCETSGMLLKPKLDYLMDYGFEQQAKEMIFISKSH